MNGQLQARGLHHTYGGEPVLRGVDVDIGRGWTAIVGPNGAGKSTLLRLLAGLLPVQRGELRLDGRPLHALRTAERARRIAWLGQVQEVSGELTVRETVALGRLPHHGLLDPPDTDDQAAIDAALDATESRPWQHRRLLTLSGGERQRALLARALATGADVLLLDEPTTHLDPPHQVALARLVRRLAATHTVVTVMHDLPLALAADRILLLADGTVAADAPTPDPALHAALTTVFDDAIRIHWLDGRIQVAPAL